LSARIRIAKLRRRLIVDIKTVYVNTVDICAVDLLAVVMESSLNMTTSKSESLRNRFAKNLKSLRNSQGISQEYLAELAGFHRTYVSQIERGVGNISLDNIEKMAIALSVDPIDFFKL